MHQGLQDQGKEDEHGAADEEGQDVRALLPIIDQQQDRRGEGIQRRQRHKSHGQGRDAHSRTVPSLGPTIFTAVP